MPDSVGDHASLSCIALSVSHYLTCFFFLLIERDILIPARANSIEFVFSVIQCFLHSTQIFDWVTSAAGVTPRFSSKKMVNYLLCSFHYLVKTNLILFVQISPIFCQCLLVWQYGLFFFAWGWGETVCKLIFKLFNKSLKLFKISHSRTRKRTFGWKERIPFFLALSDKP